MEFDEMKKIWDAQNNQTLYAIDEKALHERVMSKKRRSGHNATFTEWVLIVFNLAGGVFVTAVNTSDGRQAIFIYLMAAWMFFTAGFVLVNRIRRTRDEKRFDRSVLGDLEQAIFNATYQVRLSHLMRWNILPIAGFVLLAFWETGTPAWIAVVVIVMFGLAMYASRWEHRIYEDWKKEVETLYYNLKEGDTIPAG